jgi:hypothetical protein
MGSSSFGVDGIDMGSFLSAETLIFIDVLKSSREYSLVPFFQIPKIPFNDLKFADFSC